MSFTAGWVHSPRDIADTCEYFARIGPGPYASDQRPEIKGFWKRLVASGVKAVFLWEWEKKLLGKSLPADAQWAGQDPGSCVGRGTYRAIQDTHGTAILENRIVGVPALLCWETIYAGSRIRIGKGALGRSGGSMGAWAARYVHDFGVLPRGVYGAYDLTKSREDLGTAWSMPGFGTPQPLEQLSAQHRVPSAAFVRDTDELADSLAARFAGTCCSSHAFGPRDANGESRYAEETAHCEEWCGVYVRMDGSTGFVRRNSHSDATPQGPRVLRYDGDMIELPNGGYGITEASAAAAIKTGENWVFAPPQDIRGA